MHGLLIFLDHEAQFMFVMPWQFPLLTLPLWCRWSCCRNSSEDWPPLQIQSPLQQKYCMLKVTITVHLLVSSAPEHHRPRHTWHWPWACTDLDSSRRGASSKTSSRKVEHSVSEHSQRRSPDGFAMSWHFPVALYQLAPSTPSLGAVLVALISRPQPLPAILVLTADLSSCTSTSPWPPHSLYLFIFRMKSLVILRTE